MNSLVEMSVGAFPIEKNIAVFSRVSFSFPHTCIHYFYALRLLLHVYAIFCLFFSICFSFPPLSLPHSFLFFFFSFSPAPRVLPLSLRRLRQLCIRVRLLFLLPWSPNVLGLQASASEPGLI